jgi:hypothetical protein
MKIIPAGRHPILTSLCLLLCLAATAPAQSTTPEPMQPAEGGNAVSGLSLPADLTVSADSGFIEIEATSEGVVKFAVLGSVPVRFKALPKSVIVATPHGGGKIIVLAVAVVSGAPTDFCQTVITVTPGPAPPGPGPTPPVPPVPVVNGKLFITIVVDPISQTPAQAAVIGSAAVRQLIAQRGQLRVVDRTDPFLAAKKLDTFVVQIGSYPGLIVQDEIGVVRLATKLPATEADALTLIRGFTGASQ